MNLYELYPTKELKKLKEDKTYVTENLINSLHINMPSTFGDYPIKELELELRCYLPTTNDGVTEYSEYMGYQIDVTQKVAEIPITNDITGAVQIVKVMIIATKDGNVIGKTNFVDKQIYDAPLKGDPLTPREEFDTVIREQREVITEQGQTITEQQGTITEQGEQITELNGEVTELTTENTRLENLTETQRQTIQNMIDNPPQPKLETPEIVTPSGIVQQITPDTEEGYVGLTSVTVDRVTAEVDSDIQPENIKEGVEILGVEGTFNPFPEHSVGGIYITEVDEDGYPVKFLIKNYERTLNTFPIFFYKGTNAVRALEEVIFENCPNIEKLSNNYFSGLTYLKRLILPSGLVELCISMCENCSSLTTIEIPAGVTRIGINALSGTSIVQLNIPHGVEYIYNLPIRTLKILHLPNTLTSIGATGGYFFYGVTSIEHLYLENGYNLDSAGLFSAQTKLVAEDIVGCLNALKDRTGETAYTFGIGTTNANKLTAEEIAIATNKNWNLA